MSKSHVLVTVGKIGAVYGIKGWLKINSFTDIAENIFEYQPWHIMQGKAEKQYKVVDWRRHSNGLIAKFDGLDDRDAASTLTHAEILVPEDALPALPEDEFYWRDLEGASVINEQGYDMGTVEQMMETGANDVLVVKANAKDAFGKRERLIPYIEDQVIKQVDLATKRIKVDWDPGF